MANTFTPATLNLNNGGHSVPLPGVATMSSGGVAAAVLGTPGQSYIPVAPLPIGGISGGSSTAI